MSEQDRAFTVCGIEKGSIEENMIQKLDGNQVSDILLSRYYFNLDEPDYNLSPLPDEITDISFNTNDSINKCTDMSDISFSLLERLPDYNFPEINNSQKVNDDVIHTNVFGFMQEKEYEEEQLNEEELLSLEKCSKLIKEWEIYSDERKKKVNY